MTTPSLPPHGALHTADQAAVVLDVPATTIRRWYREGRAAAADFLPARGRRGCVTLFSLEELQPLAAAYHARRHAADHVDERASSQT